MSERAPWLAGSSRGSNSNSGGRRESSLETTTKALASGRGPAEGRGGRDGDGDNDNEHQEFMRELASHNGLQLRCSQGEDERARHRREVDRRVQVQHCKGARCKGSYTQVPQDFTGLTSRDRHYVY